MNKKNYLLVNIILILAFTLGSYICVDASSQYSNVVAGSPAISALILPTETLVSPVLSAISKPGYLQPIMDPVFGSKITRVADDSWGAICRHHYSKDQAWNANQTVIWLNKGCDKFIDGNTYVLLPNLKTPPDSGGESRWHPTDPNAIIYISHDTLGKWNPFTGGNIILHVFAGYTDLTIGLSEGNLSNDGGMIVLYSAIAKKAFAYDLVHNIEYPAIDFSAESKVNSVSVSPLGDYIIANVSNDNAKIFDLQGNQVGATWSTYGCPSHYDLTVDLNGDEVAVGVCKTGYKGIVKRRLSDGKITVIFPMGASHTSARNLRRPGWVYVTGLYYAPYLNQILAIKLDGTAFEQLATIPNDKVSYVTEMHGSASPDGKKVIVASNWNISTGPAQSYVIETSTGVTINTATSTVAPNASATNTILLSATPTITATSKPSFTATSTSVPGTGSTLTFPSVADSYVREAGPNSNYGTNIQLWAASGTSVNYVNYLKFVVSGVVGSVQGATLRVYSTSSTVNGPAAYATTNSWTETGITWNTRPALTNSGLDDKGTITNGIWVEYNVTPLVMADGTYSFALVTTSTDSVSFSSREGSQPPQLVLNTTP
jgi:hypothetical protein